MQCKIIMIKAITNDDPLSLKLFLTRESVNVMPKHECNVDCEVDRSICILWWAARDTVTPIAYAAKMNSKKCLDLLLSKGADPDGWDSLLDMTALGIAVCNRFNDIATTLINYGAKTTRLSWIDGHTPVCILTPELEIVRNEYIKWKQCNYKTILQLLCAKKYDKCNILHPVDKYIVIKICKYVLFDSHKTI